MRRLPSPLPAALSQPFVSCRVAWDQPAHDHDDVDVDNDDHGGDHDGDEPCWLRSQTLSVGLEGTAPPDR